MTVGETEQEKIVKIVPALPPSRSADNNRSLRQNAGNELMFPVLLVLPLKGSTIIPTNGMLHKPGRPPSIGL